MPDLRSVVATPYRVGVLLIGMTTLLWRFWTMSRWSWQEDDWVYMHDAHDLPFLTYLFQDYNGHVMPGAFLINWVVTKVAPLDFAVPVIVVAFTCSALVLVWGRTLALLVGERTLVLVPLALLALTPLLIRSSLWWASALQVLPLQVFLALAIGLAARIARDPRPGDRWRLAGLFVLALLFWQKSILLLIPVTAVLLYLGAAPLTRRLRVAARALWPAVLVALVYLPLFVLRTSGESSNSIEVSTAGVSPSDGAEFFARGFGEILAPALLGGPWGTLPVDSDPWLHQGPVVSVVLGILALLAMLYIATRRRGSWLLLAAALTYALIAGGLILFSSRFQLLGQATSTTERFHLDAFAVMVVFLTLSIMGKEPIVSDARRPRPVMAGLLVSALAVSLVVGNGWQARRIGTSPAGTWADAVRTGVADLGRNLGAGEPVVLVDSVAPEGVLSPAFWDKDARLSRMLTALGSDVQFYTASATLWSVNDSGDLEPAAIEPLITAQPGPTEACGYRVEAGREVDIPMTGELYEWGWGLKIETFSDQPADLELDLDGATFAFSLPSGPQRRLLQFHGAVPASLLLRSTSPSGVVCLTDLQVGNITPAR